MTSYGDFVTVTIEGGIATVRIDNPKMNPLNSDIQTSLGRVAADLAANDEVRAAILTGGEKVFAAGVDIKEMQGMSYSEMLVSGTRLQNAFKALAELPFPTVAALEGYALGGGFELAMTCDFRVASSTVKVGQPEVLLGVIPGAGGTQRLPRLVGVSKAKELVFSGRMVDAEEALEIGMVDKLVDPGTTYEAALEMVKPYVTGPAMAIRAAKEAINRGMEAGIDAGLAIETQLFAGMFATADKQSGMTSFVENGPGKATFEGR